MPLSFIADANLDQDIVSGLIRRESRIDFALPQALLPVRMKDPDVLRLAASLNRVLVTHDVRTMPKHFSEFLQRHTSPGIILVPASMAIRTAIEELHLIWQLSEPGDWTNCIRRLPL